MYPLFQQFKAKPTWVATKVVNMDSYNTPIEITTYSDGELLIWNATGNVNINLTAENVNSLRKLLNGMADPVLVAKELKDKKEPVIKVITPLEAPKPPAVISHYLEDDDDLDIKGKKLVKNTLDVKVTTAGTTKLIQVKAPIEYPSDIVSKAFIDITDKDLVTVALPKEASNHDKIIEATLISLEKEIKDTDAKETELKSKGSAKIDAKKIEKQVSKNDTGWGANVLVNGKTARYYYKTRNLARLALSNHRVGDKNGRIA